MAATLRFLHTADWQLGARSRAQGNSSALREARFATAARIVEIARERRVDFVLLAGDTFEDVNVPRADIQRTGDLLRNTGCPVFLLSGNHDPLVPEGPYDHPALVAPSLRVLRTHEPVACGSATLYPCPVFTRTSVRDPLEDLDRRGSPTGRGFRIGLAHGSLLQAGVADSALRDDFPMDRSRAERAGLHYLALGHWHCPSIHPFGRTGLAVYPGTPEPTAVDESTADGRFRSGSIVIVTLDEDDPTPKLEWIRVAHFDWDLETVMLRSSSDFDLFRRRLEAEPAASKARRVIRFDLEGVLPLTERRRLPEMVDLASARFFSGKVDSSRLRFLPQDDAWIDGLPEGTPKLVARELVAEATKDGDSARLAQRALERLFELASGDP